MNNLNLLQKPPNSTGGGKGEQKTTSPKTCCINAIKNKGDMEMIPSGGDLRANEQSKDKNKNGKV